MAQSNCIEPYAPVIPDGAAASEEQFVTVRDQVTQFLDDSKAYQSCLTVYLRQAEDEARRDNKQVDQRLRNTLVSRFNASQDRQAQVGEAFNTQVRAFNARFAPPEGETAPAPGG